MTALKFGLVGLLNTVVGFSIILAALFAGFNDYTANALGYGFGLLLSYSLNRYWTFSVKYPASFNELMLFGAAFAISYVGNLLVLTSFRASGVVGQPVVHFIGLVVYSILFYILSRTIVFRQDSPILKVNFRLILRNYRPEFILFIIAVVTWIVFHNIPITHDVVWQYWIARQIQAGSILYKDIWELNPPLWFWSAIPIVYVGELFHYPALRLMIPVVIGAGTASALAVGYLTGVTTPIRRFAIMLGAFWLTIIAPVFDFGQREQFALICALPYAALIARRFSGYSVPTALAVLVGIGGAYGFALKHYFVLIPLLLEVWLLFGHQRWRPVRPETMVLAGCALAYAAATFIFAPDFFTIIVPMVKVAYHGYESSLQGIFYRPWMFAWAGIAAFFFIYRGAIGRRADPAVSAFLIVAIGFAFGYFMQAKGWRYHSLTVSGAGSLALILRMGLPDMRRVAPFLAGSAILIMTIMLLPLKSGFYSNTLRAGIDPEIMKVPSGERVFIATADPQWAWPVVEDYNLVWPSRLYSYWMIPAIAHGEVIGPNPPELRLLASRISQQADLEIRCSAPALVIFERKRNYEYQPPSFDVREFFLRNMNINKYIEDNYEEIEGNRELYIYKRVVNVKPMTDSSCPEFK